MLTNLLLEGVNLMLIGMGMVFVFLAMLVLVMTGMSRFARMVSPEEQEPVGMPAQIPLPTDDEQQIVAVISAAISRYRSTTR